MIKINKKTAPDNLTRFKNNIIIMRLTPEEEYDKLTQNSRLKNQVKTSLMEEQGHLCAYCMRTIPDSRVSSTSISPVSIEHWIPRNSSDTTPILGTGLGVEYTNLLAVCSGGKVPKGSAPGNELTCDAKRGNISLTVNPLDSSTLASIYYKQNGEIAATDPIIEKDLVNTLNLNCIKYSSLPDSRKKTLEPIEEAISSCISEEEMLLKCHELLQMYEEETDPKTPFCGIIIWWLKNYIEVLEA